MRVAFTDEVSAVEARLDDRSYDSLWNVLEEILSDPEYARHAPWANYVSSRRLWGTKIPGTDYSIFWRHEGEVLTVHHIVADRGL